MSRTAHVYCGNYVGPPRWQGLEAYEPDECNWEGDVPLPDDPADDAGAIWTCPGCKAVNTVADHS